jgi:hypothetical protein
MSVVPVSMAALPPCDMAAGAPLTWTPPRGTIQKVDERRGNHWIEPT